MTKLHLMCAACGLSLREAAVIFGISFSTAKSWSSGRLRTPPWALEKLAEIHREIEAAADIAFEAVRAGHGLTVRDGEYPGTQAVVIGTVLARSIRHGIDVELTDQ